MIRKLFLTSDGFTTFIDFTEAFLQLVGQTPNYLSVAIIPTAHGRG